MLGKFLIILSSVAMTTSTQAQQTPAPVALAIHGGAGVISRADIPEENVPKIRADLDRALDAGNEVLKRGGSALDAVTAAVVVLEDSP